MEPKLPMPNLSSERGPSTPDKSPAEYAGAEPAERAVEANGGESIEQARERLSGIGAGDAASFATPVAVPSPSQVQLQDDTSTMHADDMPLVAADEDLIEKEWVDKAKKIVDATRDDPYAQEQEVSKLQADYLQKRYGKEVKLSNQY